MFLSLHQFAARAARAITKAKTQRPWTTRLDKRVYRVTPRTRDTGIYIVTFRVTPDGGRYAECRHRHTDELCPANARGRFCYHLGAAYLRHIKNARRDCQRAQEATVTTH